MTRKEIVFFGLTQLFFATLLFPRVTLLTILAAAAVVLSSLLLSPLREKWHAIKKRRYLQAMLLFFGWIVVSLLLSEYFKPGLSFLDPRLALFYFPLCMGSLQLRTHLRNRILLGFALLTTLALLVCLGYGIVRSQGLAHPEFLYNDSLTEVLGQQSIYVALLVNISIYILVYFILFQKPIPRVLLLLATLFLFGMSYLLASRIMLATLAAVTVGFCLYLIFRRKQYRFGGLLLAGLVASVVAVALLFPSTLNRFKELTYTQFNYQSEGAESHYNMQVDSTQWNGANFRRAAWACGWQLFTQHPILGVGLGDKKIELFRVYEEKQFDFALRTNKNVHNNYLDILYSLGLIGLLLFVTAWIILPLHQAIKYKDGLAALVVLTFAAAWVTEIYFDRSLGGMLTGFLIPLLFTDKPVDA